MLRWNNDYNRGAHPAVIAALADTNGTSYGGYGLDEWCERGASEIRKHLGGADADVHFLIGGTQANFTVIAAALRPYESVLCADTGHIHVHETGAVENTGHKIEALKSENGKITADQIAAEGERYRTSGVQEHITRPGMVYLSFPTEYGTLYTKSELEDIRAVCREYGMLLFVDGARMAYGLGAEGNDVTLAELARLTDVFYIGGTKCGALFGEAVVITHPALKPHFRSYIKQNGAMLAKGWLLGLQFYTLFSTGVYFDAAKRADAYARRIKAALTEKGIPLYIENDTNQQFCILSADQMEKLGAGHIFEYEFPVDDTRHCVRFCTSWATEEKDVDALVRDIAAL